MERIQQFQPNQIAQAIRQAPWRVEAQVTAALAAILVVVIAISGMYLAEASRAATAGRDVQQLEILRDDLLRENDALRAEIARLQSVARVEARARELGYYPATVNDLQFLPLTENIFATEPLEDDTGESPADEFPVHDETVGEWLVRNIETVLGEEQAP